MVHVVLPGDVDDPNAPSGGNVYDRRVCQGLEELGWRVHRVGVGGAWPRPGPGGRAALARALGEMPDGAIVLLDGLVACGVPEIVVPHADRLRVAVLVHLPLAAETGIPPETAAELDRLERETLRAAALVVATSEWAGRGLVERHGLDPDRVGVAAPGTDSAPMAPGTDGASRLLCVASVTPRKGHDVLVRALASLADLAWDCVCVGPLGRDGGFADRVREMIAAGGLGDRIRLAGPLAGEPLEAAYAAADLMVLASRAETYGMVVTEALARGIPVLTTTADALPETLGHAPDGSVPGLLVPPDDPAALADALRRWLTEPVVRVKIRTSVRHRRGMLHGWTVTSRQLAALLERLRR
ncbi:glycosyltransferase family 4 protein [Thermopolyspora sp. NPDC052614]|uniref:glycosyltransferase family 4 protein n=1 Tax=Thermopolyspora sp. NPDC052614 TaxID=3155682 RepID=UPI00344658BB